MNTFIGTKVIQAKPMTRQEYNDYRGWQLPADENGYDAGMLVEYVDGGKANDARHAGYISWSPMDVFHRAYRPVTGMTFGLALEVMKMGKRVARAGWNGKGMWIRYVHSLLHTVDGVEPDALLPWIGMKTADSKFVPWLASQTDMLAEDWEIAE